MKLTYDESKAADYVSALAVIMLIAALIAGRWLNVNDGMSAVSLLVSGVSLLWLLPISAVMGFIAAAMLLRQQSRERAALLLLAAGVVALIYYAAFFVMNSDANNFALLGINVTGVSSDSAITAMGAGFWIGLYAALTMTAIGVVLQVLGVTSTILMTGRWRAEVYTAEIDGLLAQLALDDTKPDVSEAAARAIGRIRSEAAIHVLAEHQRKGERRALRALALVRDEAPSLPGSVSRQARLYTWLSNTWRRLSDEPIRAVSRALLVAVFGGLAVWYYAFSELPSAAIFFAERWGKSLTTGVTFGVVYGLVVLLGAEVPERLRGFWPWWARLILNLILGMAAGVLVWVVFAWFFLYYQPTPEDFGSILFGAFGAATAFSLGVLFHLPGWLNVIWTTVMLYIPLYVTLVNFMPPLVYIRPGEDISQYGLPLAVLIGVGAYLPQLVGDVRWLIQRGRGTPTPPEQPPQPATAAS